MKKSRSFFAALTAALYAICVTLIVVALSRAVPVAAFTEPLKVVIDAGHGGIDGGVVGKTTGVKESDLNLKIALLLGQRLQENGVSVVYTRTTPSGLYDTTAKGFKKRDMEKRNAIVQENAPCVVVSVHQNYYGASYCRGATVFYGNENGDGKRLADGLQARLNALYQDQGVKGRKSVAGDFFLLKTASCPSVLVECGFLSSPADEKLLLSDSFTARIVSALSSGITAYFAQNGSA